MSTRTHDLATGVKGFGRALGFAFRNGLGWTFLLPIVLWLLFAAGMVTFGAWLTDVVGGWAAAHLQLDVPAEQATGWAGFWDQVKSVLNGARDILVFVVLKLALFFLIGILGKYVVLIVLSPLLAYASERTEQLITGHTHPFLLGRFLRDLLRGIVMALRNGLLELAIGLAAWIGTLFIPVIAPVTALFVWLVSCWFYGFSMFDYVFERQGLGVQASTRAARSRRGLVLGNGIAFNLLMKVPLVGMVFAPLLAAIGAVLAWHADPRTPHPDPSY